MVQKNSLTKFFIIQDGNDDRSPTSSGNGLGGGMNSTSNSINIGSSNHHNGSSTGGDDNIMMNSAFFQAMQAAGDHKNVLSGTGSSQTNNEFSQMFSAALLQGGINRFASNGA